jgi:dipeptidyl aminopeptidase/acylaminoacyl peptidase
VRLKKKWLSAAVQLWILNAAVFAQSAAKLDLVQAIDQLFAARGFRQVAISPDGGRVGWVEWLPDNSGNSAIQVVALNQNSSPLRISVSKEGVPGQEGNLAWAADGKQLAFLSDVGNPGQRQLYIASLDGSPPRQLTKLTGFLDEPKWSPDGRTIAFLFTENAPRASGPLMPMTVESGVIASKVYEQRLALVDVASGEVKQISPPDMYVYEFEWSPDGKTFVTTAAPGAGDSQWYVAQLYRLPSAGGEMKSIYKPPLQIAIPKWSPDGKNIAFIGGIMSDEGSVGGDIFVVPATGGEARNVTPGIQSSPTWLRWQSPGKILFSEVVDGKLGVSELDLTSGKTSRFWSGPELVSSGAWGVYEISLAADLKTSAVIRQSFSRPPEVWAGAIGAWKQVSHLNDAVKPSWGETRSISWTNDGMKIQGWLTLPRDYDPRQRYPMVVSVHGGPAAFNGPEWPAPFYNQSLLSTSGYFVFYPNPRGSFGAGEAFARANVKDFGYGDFRDIMSGVDQVLKDFPVDRDRIGITGWSYGGYMTMWAVTQTTRFAAAVAGAGLSNFQSYYGLNDIDEWMMAYFGATVYDDPAVYARSSPITFIKQARTPTLVLVGDRDGECPPPQSREFWHALKTLGVESQLVIYPDEGHYIAQPEHQRDIIVRMISWFDKYLKMKK